MPICAARMKGSESAKPLSPKPVPEQEKQRRDRDPAVHGIVDRGADLRAAEVAEHGKIRRQEQHGEDPPGLMEGVVEPDSKEGERQSLQAQQDRHSRHLHHRDPLPPRAGDYRRGGARAITLDHFETGESGGAIRCEKF